MCAEPNGQSTSGLKMEPKCIAIIQATELGNPHVLLLQVGQSQERYKYRRKGCQKKQMLLCNATDRERNIIDIFGREKLLRNGG